MPSKFPNSIDDASSLYLPADAFSAKPLETITTMPVYAGDTTISVESTGVGFPDEYGILSIDDELIVYTGKTATQFTGCQRGAFGTIAAQHAAGATVRANKVTVDDEGRVTAGANLAAADLPSLTQTAADIVSGEFPHNVQKDGADVGTRRTLNLVQGTRVSLGAADDPANDRVSVTISASPPEAGEITNALGYIPANRAGDHFSGPIDCGPHPTIGGPLENMAKHSENFAAAVWDKNGGSCSVTSNAVIAPDGNQTADVITAVTDTPVIQQQIASLTDGGTYTFYIWARVPSGTHKVSIAIVDNPYAAYLAGPTQITLTTSWQRFKITGTLASGQTGLWIVVRHFAANGDDWTTGNIHLWGACLQQGGDPQAAYARTWATQTPHIASGIASGPTVIAAPDTTTSPLKIHSPGSNLADSTLLEVTAQGELILAGGLGNGYRFAELGAATNPSGWSGVLKVKTPAGATLGYILLYTTP